MTHGRSNDPDLGLWAFAAPLVSKLPYLDALMEIMGEIIG